MAVSLARHVENQVTKAGQGVVGVGGAVVQRWCRSIRLTDHARWGVVFDRSEMGRDLNGMAGCWCWCCVAHRQTDTDGPHGGYWQHKHAVEWAAGRQCGQSASFPLSSGSRCAVVAVIHSAGRGLFGGVRPWRQSATRVDGLSGVSPAQRERWSTRDGRRFLDDCCWTAGPSRGLYVL
ncbi:hypothetical protein BKA81DRAFT_39308 [Phyllosticta paracitricarpa]